MISLELRAPYAEWLLDETDSDFNKTFIFGVQTQFVSHKLR